jgi:hypothetical protein
MLLFSKMKFPLAHTIAISLVVLMIAVCAPIVNAQTTLAAQLISRPVTNDDINGLKLPATVERSGGLNTVGLGQAAYLEADVDITVPASQIAGVKWTIASQPSGSKAVLEDSPLGSNVPVYLPSDRLIYQVAARKLFRPDVSGIYNINATITTSGSGVATVSMMITGSTYVGISACSQCHANGAAGTPFSMVNAWSKTAHSQIFTARAPL